MFSSFLFVPGLFWLICIAYFHVPFVLAPSEPQHPSYPTVRYVDRDSVWHPMSSLIDCQLVATRTTIALIDTDEEGTYQYGVTAYPGLPLEWHCAPRLHVDEKRKSSDWQLQ